MIRGIAALSLLLASGVAAGQGVTFIPAPDMGPAAFQDVYSRSSGRVFIIGHPFDEIVGAAQPSTEQPRPPLKLDPSAFDTEQSLVTEGEGIRLPAEQFSLAK